MKIKTMAKKGIDFVKEHEVKIAFGGAAFVYGVGMYLWGLRDGRESSVKECIECYGKEIRIGTFTRELEVHPGKYTFDRFFNEDHFNGKINGFNKAVELLSDPENTKDIVGMVICRKEND